MTCCHLCAPPPSGPSNFGWHTPPSGPWLCKVIGLLYDLVGLASNTKLQSVKVMKAMQNLHKGNVLTVTGKPEDVLDKCDLCIRALMAMLRTAKTNENLRSRAFRLLTRDEQVKIEMTLERVSLPPSFWVPEDEEKPEAALSEMHGALVPVVPAKQDRLACEKASLGSTGVGSVGGLLQMPAIFAKLDEGALDAKPTAAPLCGSMGEEELLQSSMQYVSKVALKPQAKKKPAVKKKPKKVEKNPVENSQTSSRSKSLTFDSAHWGKCKLEVYKEKSYIRYLDITTNKWKQLIGSVVAEIHGDVCRKLVPHVTSGLGVSDLYKKREKIVEELTNA